VGHVQEEGSAGQDVLDRGQKMIGWAGVLLIFLGNVRLAYRHPNAFILLILGHVMLLISGLITHEYYIAALGLISAIIHTRNFIWWNHDPRHYNQDQDRDHQGR